METPEIKARAIQNKRILLVDDEAQVISAIRFGLEVEGFKGSQILDAYSEGSMETFFPPHTRKAPNLVLLDIRMQGRNGLDILADYADRFPHIPFIVMSGYLEQDLISQAKQKGAYEVVRKAAEEVTKLPSLFYQALRPQPYSREIRQLRTAMKRNPPGDIVGISTGMIRAYQDTGIFATSPDNKLIVGAEGTGKTLIAQKIHDLSGRTGPFIHFNCLQVPPTMQHQALFGSEKGAFTDSNRFRQGAFAQANRGTLFLDEITNLEPESQAILLTAVEQHKFTVLGSEEPEDVDILIVAATNNIQRFRGDLRRRFPEAIFLPELRHRIEDIPLYWAYFLEKHGQGFHPDVAAEVLADSMRQPWPGNVRQLEGVVKNSLEISGRRGRMIRMEFYQRAMEMEKVFVEDDTAEYEFLDPLTALRANITLEEAMDNYERQYLLAALRVSRNMVVETCLVLGIDDTKLMELARKHNISLFDSGSLRGLNPVEES